MSFESETFYLDYKPLLWTVHVYIWYWNVFVDLFNILLAESGVEALLEKWEI